MCEGFIAYNHGVWVAKAHPLSTDTVDAAIEDKDIYVGTVAGVKSDYHNNYVAKLSDFPPAKYLEFFHGQLWAANMLDDPYRVRWSAAQPAYKVWPTVNNELVMEDDRSPITGMRAFGEHLAVFKQDSIWRMVYTGTGLADLNTYVPIKVPGGIGTVSNSSIVDINGVLVFLAEDGVYAFDGSNKPEKLSGAIDDTIAKINPGKRAFAAAVHWRTKNCYLLAVALEGSICNNYVLCYDYKQGCWWINDSIEALTWTRDEGVHDDEMIYFADRRGDIFLLGSGSTDYGQAITSSVETHRIGHNDSNTYTLREVKVNATCPDISSLDVIVKTEDQRDTDRTTGTLTYVDSNEDKLGSFVLGTDTLSADERRERCVKFRKTGQWHTVKLNNDEKGDRFALHGLRVGMTSWGKR
jgi:hypothetical protein